MPLRDCHFPAFAGKAPAEGGGVAELVGQPSCRVSTVLYHHVPHLQTIAKYCHCASWFWTLGLLAAGVLRRFCSQQLDLVSSPFGEGLVVLPAMEYVDGLGALVLLMLALYLTVASLSRCESMNNLTFC